MFQSVLDYTKELQNNVQYTQAFLRKLRGARTRIVNRIAKAEEQVALMKNPDRYVKSLDETLRSETIKTGKDVIQGSILEAVRTNHEFDWPEYKQALFRATRDNEIYTVRALGGTAWNTRYTVSIDMDNSAGRLNRWAAGVKAYRKILDQEKQEKAGQQRDKKGRYKKYRKPRYDPVAASKAWANIFSSRGDNPRFRTTIRERLELSGAVAPFWQLLDKGSVPMSSDRGGYPTPEGELTNFVDKAQTVMEQYLKNLLNKYKKNYDKLFEEYSAFLGQAEQSLSEIESKIQEVSVENKVIDRLEQELARENQIIDRNKLEQAVQKIREGLLTTGSVSLTARGSPERVRRSVASIQDYLTDY
jgi:hypothetical protein